jgi:hypothetical protein
MEQEIEMKQITEDLIEGLQLREVDRGTSCHPVNVKSLCSQFLSAPKFPNIICIYINLTIQSGRHQQDRHTDRRGQAQCCGNLVYDVMCYG